MTTAFIKINFSNEHYFNIYVGSDGDPKTITKYWNTFINYVYLDELEKGNKSRLNWQYLASNFMKFITEQYINKTSFNLNRVCIAPNNWEKNADYIYEITPIEKLYSNFDISINKTIEFKVLNGEDNE